MSACSLWQPSLPSNVQLQLNLWDDILLCKLNRLLSRRKSSKISCPILMKGDAKTCVKELGAQMEDKVDAKVKTMKGVS